MLNPFPGLLDYAILSPFIIRLVLGFIVLNLGFLKLRGERERWTALFRTFLGFGGSFVFLVALVEILAGSLIVVGLFTQVAALAVALLSFVNLYLEMKEDALVKRDFVFYATLFAMSLSLLLTGAGFLAFDLPL